MPTLPDLVLVGGGHSHVQVLLRHRERPFAARVTIILDQPEAVYSGMVPGFVAGEYTATDLTIDVWALARTANVRVVDGAALRVDTERRRVEVAGRGPIAYDTVSIDIGSTVAGLGLKGVREHALATRPIGRLVAEVDARIAALSSDDPRPIIVVGAGAAGIELAYCLNARTKRDVVVVSDPVASPGGRLLTRRPGVSFVGGRVIEATYRGVLLDPHTELAGALVVWAAGAAALPLAEASDLPCVNGFIDVGATLQVTGQPAIFAVGDCAHVVQTRGPGRGKPLPKAGVYAVRMGPILCANLDARLTGTVLSPYVPQTDFLSLLNLGDGTAVGRRSGGRVEGAWVWRLKDRIDRKFMAMFQVLGADGLAAGMSANAVDEEMPCGGCAAKVGAAELHRALASLAPIPADPTVEMGLAAPDDAAIVRVPGGDRLGLTVDAFTAFCDDPWSVGRVAAVNAVNDLYVKGITPRWALATVAVPPVPGMLEEAMSGIRHALDGLGISLVGGHTLRGEELCVGLSVVGTLAPGAPAHGPAKLHDDDVLVLTRGLGSGVLLRANMMGGARGAWVREALQWMARSHREAAGVLATFAVQAATDVTGFGLYGHLATLLARSVAAGGAVGCEVEVAELPLYPGASALFAAGVRSTFHAQNVRGVTGIHGPGLDHPLAGLGFDPQTAGPLLFALPGHRLDGVLAALAAVGEPARRIGSVVAGPGIRLV